MSVRVCRARVAWIQIYSNLPPPCFFDNNMLLLRKSISRLVLYVKTILATVFLSLSLIKRHINDNWLQSYIFIVMDDLLSSGSSGEANWMKIHPPNICGFPPVFIDQFWKTKFHLSFYVKLKTKLIQTYKHWFPYRLSLSPILMCEHFDEGFDAGLDLTFRKHPFIAHVRLDN